MPSGIRRTLAVLLLATWACVAPPAKAQDQDPYKSELDYSELAWQVANTAIVWADDPEKMVSVDVLAREFVNVINWAKEEQRPELVEVFESLGAFVIRTRPERAEQLLERAKAALRADKDTDRKRLVALYDGVSADMIVVPFDTGNCGEPKELTSSNLPADAFIGVERVAGTAPVGTGNKVWVIDSGIDNASGYFTIDNTLAADCVNLEIDPVTGEKECDQTNPNVSDSLGHGTIIAGIIAASRPNKSVPDIQSVAPGATIVPVKIFGTRPFIDLSGPPLRALNHVLRNASAGDVVNISWGANWLEFNKRRHFAGLQKLIKKFQKLHTKGLKVAIAAGNLDPIARPGWVQYVFPADSGSFPNPRDGCKICTVSAVRSEIVSGGWVDNFWNEPASGKGSNYGVDPPDFAEPGVRVWSLWPQSSGAGANRLNHCTGTSFATAHLSGIFVKGMPKIDKHAIGDPDTDPPLPGDSDERDPIGVCCK